MSWWFHPSGSDTSDGGGPTTLTLLNVAVQVTPATWLETARPIRIVDGMVKVSLLISVQVLPSDDSYAEIVLPARVSFTQRGAPEALPAVPVLPAPSDFRRWKATPFDRETSANAWAEPALSEVRIITPALAQVAVFWMVETFATIEPSPVRGWETKFSASAVPPIWG